MSDRYQVRSAYFQRSNDKRDRIVLDLTAGTRIIPKTGLSLTARLLGALIILVVVVASAYLVHTVFEPGIGNVLAGFLILAGFLTLVAMIAESIIGKK